MDCTSIQVIWLFFAFIFTRLDNSAFICGWFGFKIYSNTTAMVFVSCFVRTKRMLFKINITFAKTHKHTSKFQQPRNFNKFTAFCWADGLIWFDSIPIEFVYDRFILRKLPAENHEIDIFVRQCSFIECVIYLAVICENSQVKCQLCMWHIIFIP